MNEDERQIAENILDKYHTFSQLAANLDTMHIPSPVRKILREVHKVKFTLAFDPTPEFTTKLYDWFKTVIKDLFILDIYVQKEIVGGFLASYKGVYVDKSASKMLDTYFDQNLDHVKELL